MGEEKIFFKGIGVTNKKTSGIIRLFEDKENVASSPQILLTKEKEKARFQNAVSKAVEATENIAKKARETLGESEAQIFEIHAMLLQDEDFLEGVLLEIEDGKSAEEATIKSGEKYSQLIMALGDEYLSARALDIKDICSTIIDFLTKKKEENVKEEEPYILFAKDLTPSQTVKLDKSRILGFVTSYGTPSSHTSILARAMGIPAIVGVGEIKGDINGKMALLDGGKGTLVINPSRNEKESFLKEMQYEDKIAIEHDKYIRSLLNTPAVTRGGQRIMIYANIGDSSEVDGALLNGAEGIGLLRSEFLYLSRSTYPSEEELFSAYHKIVSKMQGKRVIIRTLDIGADKRVSYFNLDSEENPALGYRGIRLCLDRKEIFKVQIRAILRASAYGRIGIMLPMISTLGEVKRAKELIKEAKDELRDGGIAFDEKIELGIMIETPASAIISDLLAPLVSFFSVGTNDLTQYTMAVDRQNSKVASICEENEAVLRLIKMATDSIHNEGGWIGICGEMAADLSLTQSLINIGVDELSVSAPYLLGVRGKVCDSK